MLVVAAFTGANLLQPESGLLAVTVMGVFLANQRWADVRHIVEFKENLRVLLISSLFILLAARLKPAELTQVAAGGVLFVAVLVCVIRPVVALVCGAGSTLTRNERLFVAWMAPRGIVAAAIASVFALRLEELGFEDAPKLVSITFVVIIGTVAVYGLTSPFAALRLGLADANPQGVLFVGAHGWVRALAKLLQDKGFRVLLVDSNRSNITKARMAGLPTYTGSVLAEYAITEMRLGGIGRILAVTPNDWVNTLAAQRFVGVFGRANCYQLAREDESQPRHPLRPQAHGRRLFASGLTGSELSQRFAGGATIKATTITKEFTYAEFMARNEDAIPLFVLTQAGRLSVVAADKPPAPTAGQTLISLARAAEEAGEKRT
jgi:hypothetical protein